MKRRNEVRTLSIAASELLQQAARMEMTGSIRTKDAAERLRKEAHRMLSEAERSVKLAQSRSTAENKLREMALNGEKLAKEVRYNADILCVMRDAGTITKIARDHRMPVETLEYYTALAIRKQVDKAVQLRMVRAWKGLPKTADILKADEDTIRRFLLSGASVLRISQKLQITRCEVLTIARKLSEPERLARTLAIKARCRRRHEKIWELRKRGLSEKEIASRAGCSRGLVKGVLQGNFKISEDLYQREGLKEARA